MEEYKESPGWTQLMEIEKSSEMKVQNPVTSEVRKPWEMATSDLQ